MSLDPTIKLFMQRSLLILAGLFALLTVWNFFHTGEVSVITDRNDYSIAVYRTGGQGNINIERVVKSGQGNLHTHLSTGTYVVQVQTQRIIVATKTIQVRFRETANFSFKTQKLDPTEPVADLLASSMVADNSQLLYIDPDSNKVNRLDSQNILSGLYADYSFQSVQWIGPGYGVGQDDRGNIYEISGDSVQLIPLPFPSDASLRYSLASNKRLYLLSGSDIYAGLSSYTGITPGTFKKIHTTKAASPRIAASVDNLAIMSIVANGENNPDPYVEVINNSGKLLSSKKLTANVGIWSPDGKQLLLIDSDSTSGIYDTQLRRTRLLPNETISDAVWTSNNSLLYGVNDLLWSYSVNDSTATTVARNTRGTIEEIVVDADNNYAYLAAKTEDGKGVLSRYGLKQQVVEDFIYKLGEFLPDTLDECLLGYINFSRPTVVLRPYSSEGIGACRQAAITRLQDYGLDPYKFSYSVGTILTEAD